MAHPAQGRRVLGATRMGHLVHCQAGREFPRRWLRELFCNLCLHAYVAAQEPEQLPVRETFPRLIAGGDALSRRTTV